MAGLRGQTVVIRPSQNIGDVPFFTQGTKDAAANAGQALSDLWNYKYGAPVPAQVSPGPVAPQSWETAPNPLPFVSPMHDPNSPAATLLSLTGPPAPAPVLSPGPVAQAAPQPATPGTAPAASKPGLPGISAHPRLPSAGGLDLRALNDYARQMGEMTKSQQDKLQAAADKLRNTPGQVDLSALMSLADSWNKTNLAQGYQRPMSKAELERQAMAIEQGAADVGLQGLKGQLDVTKTKLDLQAHAQDMAMKQAMNEQDLALKRQELGLKALQNTPGSKPMSAEEMKRFDNISMALQAAKDARDNWGNGQRNTLLKDNPYTIALRRWTEAIGRLQSGGAIGEKEGAQFRALLPTLTDELAGTDEATIQMKFDQAMSEMQNRLNTMGKNPDQVLGSRIGGTGNVAPSPVAPSLGMPWEKYGSKA